MAPHDAAPHPARMRQLILKLEEPDASGGQISAQDYEMTPTTVAGVQHVLAGRTYSLKRSFSRYSALLLAKGFTAARQPDGPVATLATFYRLVLAPLTHQELVSIRANLEALDQIAYVIPARSFGRPPEFPADVGDDLESIQGYLDPADVGGVDARAAWAVDGGPGSQVALGVVDVAYLKSHRDLPSDSVLEPLYSQTDLPCDHGTRVLGVLCGNRDGIGVTGIAYDLGRVYFANYEAIAETSVRCFDVAGEPVTCLFLSAGTYEERVQLLHDERILMAMDDLVMNLLEWADGPRIMLLEVTTVDDLPVEFDPDTRAFMRWAADSDAITVVEPAANRGVLLDDIDVPKIDDGSPAKLWGADADESQDSLAVMVGAGVAPVEEPDSPGNWRTLGAYSNYGRRVDCQGWGGGVVTASATDEGKEIEGSYYTNGFNGTSSASAMVAGVAACLQGARLAALMDPLYPDEVRALLADPDFGSPQPEGDAASHPIGPLPDLAKLLKTCSDVFLRDHVGDTGEVPFSGSALCRSPDIILRREVDPDPATTFGAGAWEDDDLCESAAAGRDNYVYIRLDNRGSYPDDAEVTVYWSPPSTFLYPDDWTEIGRLTADAVLPDEQRVIPNPLIWKVGDQPEPGHYCLIAVAATDTDAVDVVAALDEAGSFSSLVRDRNNISYRNIDVVESEAGSDSASMTFLVRGLPKKVYARPDRDHGLVIRPRLPRGAVVHVDHTRLEVQGPHLAAAGPGTPPRLGGRPREPLTLQGPLAHRIEGITLDPDEKVPVTLRVTLPTRTPPGRYLVAAEQYWRGKLLGRVNFEIRVRPTA